MHVPSPSEYQPLDPSAPLTFEQTYAGNYIIFAVTTLVLYDHAITLDIEVERIWSLKWGLAKALFMTSRYVVPPLLMLVVIDLTGYPLPFSFCEFGTRFHRPVSALSLFVAEIVLLIRVSALYHHEKIILGFLACLFTCQFIAVIICTTFALTVITPVLYYQYLPGCWVDIRPTTSARRWSYSWWIPFISFESILLVLTIFKAIPYRNTPAVRLVARDSLYMPACLIANIAVYFPGNAIAVYIPTEWIACIAVSRMMMSIRGLAFDNLYSSRTLELSALAFRRQAHTSDGDRQRDAEAEQVELRGLTDRV